MSNFEIEEELLKKKYHCIYGVNIYLFFPGCGLEPYNKFFALLAQKICYLRLLSNPVGLSQYKGHSTQKYRNMLLLKWVIYFNKKSFKLKWPLKTD
jgi:hypothetical protein